MAVGDQIRRIRKEQRFSQDELGRRAGISRTGIARIERGERKPNSSTVERIAAALGVGVDKLYPKPVELSGSLFGSGTLEGELSIEERVHRVFLAARERNASGMNPDENLDRTEHEIQHEIRRLVAV